MPVICWSYVVFLALKKTAGEWLDDLGILEVHDQFTVLQVGSWFCDMICEMICLFVLVSDQMTRMFVLTSLPNLPIRLSTEKNRELGPESVGLTVQWCDCKRTVQTKYNDVYGIGMAGMVLYTEWWEWVTVSCIWQIAGCFLVPGASRQRCDMTTLPSRADLDVTACQDRGYPKTGRGPCPPWPSITDGTYRQAHLNKKKPSKDNETSKTTWRFSWHSFSPSFQLVGCIGTSASEAYHFWQDTVVGDFCIVACGEGREGEWFWSKVHLGKTTAWYKKLVNGFYTSPKYSICIRFQELVLYLNRCHPTKKVVFQWTHFWSVLLVLAV